MIRKTLYALLTVLAAMIPAARAAVAPAGDWKIHQTFPYNNQFSGVVDTKERVFMLVRGQGYWEGAVGFSIIYNTLFVYDKEADEIIGYNKRNYLSENIIQTVDYNPDKGYLLIVYNSGNIDLLYDDNRVVNISGLKSFTISSTKNVNAIAFDPERDRAYLATDFGYIEIDDKKGQIADSRIYNAKLTGAFRMGDKFFVSTRDKLGYAPAADRRQSMDDYKALDGVTQKDLLKVLPLNDNQIIINQYSPQYVYVTTIDGNNYASNRQVTKTNLKSLYRNRDGYMMTGEGDLCQIKSSDGSDNHISCPDGTAGQFFGSWDFNQFWDLKMRAGIAGRKYNNDTWTLTNDYIIPNAPASFMCEYMTPTDKWGLLVHTHGVNQVFTTDWIGMDMHLTGYKDGEWHKLAPVWNNPTYSSVSADADGIAYDPRYPDWVFLGSRSSGLTRLNLADPSDVQIYSRTGNGLKNLAGFHAIMGSGWAYAGAPSFDGDGNLMFMMLQPSAGKTNLAIWPSADLKNNNVDGIKWVPLPSEFALSWKQHSKAMQHSSNRNIIIAVDGNWDGPLLILDHKGTLDNSADDVAVVLSKVYDNTGAALSKTAINDIYEDPRTGLVWIAGSEGVFTFYPHEMIKGKHTVQRVKVARNDGTNLADYLLDGVGVNKICSDSQGRKWFATNGAGVLWTNASGTEILGQLTEDNSYLPHNTVYSIAQDKGTGSIFVSTENGIAQYFVPGTANSSESSGSDLKIYPNPVRPDYLGWINIEGTHDNGIVKIVDSAGTLVRELSAENGVCRWDGTTMDHKRARTGVYYVVSMPGQSSEEKDVKKGKLLIVN